MASGHYFCDTVVVGKAHMIILNLQQRHEEFLKISIFTWLQAWKEIAWGKDPS